MATLLENYKHTTFTGRREINPPIRARLKDEDWIRGHFDGTPHYQQVTSLTLGNIYEIHAVEGFGDVADAFVIDDTGKEQEVIIDWFADVESEGA